MKILLTGSSGFVGQFLKPRLTDIGLVVDLKSDLTNHKSVEEEVLQIKPDIIVHLAAKTEVEKSFYEQNDFSNVNYVGTVNLIESCLKLNKIPFFCFASTMEVFGWQPISDDVKKNIIPKKHIAFNENTVPNPNAPYAVAKFGCEKYLEYARRSFGLDFVALRQTNTYGRADNNFFVTEQIISQMLKKDTLSLGYAEPYRNFLYIDDLVEAWLKTIEYRHELSGNLVTLGPDLPIKIKDYAQIIAKELDWQGEINWNTKPKRAGEIYWLNSDSDLFTKITSWTPKTPLGEGIQKTISRVQSNVI